MVQHYIIKHITSLIKNILYAIAYYKGHYVKLQLDYRGRIVKR